MGAFRVIEFDAEDAYFGTYKMRMPVFDEMYKGGATVIANLSGDIEAIRDDLKYYGFGDDFMSLFPDIIFDRTAIGSPPNYDAAAVLSYVYPNMATNSIAQSTTLAPNVKVFGHTVTLPIELVVQNNMTELHIHGDIDSYGILKVCKLDWQGGQIYGFVIDIYGCYTSQLNGNKFNITENNSYAASLHISVYAVGNDLYTGQIIIYGSSNPFGNLLKESLNGNEADDAEQDSDDPYDDGGDSDGGGGGGSYDDDSDDVDFPDLPEISAVDTGFISLYVPSVTQMKDLANYMWNNNAFDIATFKKLFADPMDCVIGLSIVPYAVPSSGAVSVNVGNIPTGISMNKASAQFFALDCGSINLEEYFGSYLDYSPYTSITIFLPFIGYRELKIDECMAAKPGMTIHLKYYIDILSGSCTALIKCGRSMMYQFQGHCSIEIPFTGVEWGNAIKSAIDGATAIGNLVAEKGNPINEIGGLANSVMGCKPQVERSGHIGSAGGLLAGKHPYLIITRPRQCKPANQNKYLGYPSFVTRNLGVISGFTRMEELRLNNISCTDEEMEEIRTLLEEGVIL